MDTNDPQPDVETESPHKTLIVRDSYVVISLSSGEVLKMTDEQARAVYSQLRRWYGRNK